MIRHIVSFRLNATDPERKAADVEGLRSRLEPLAGVIPGVLGLTVRPDLGRLGFHWDAVLVSEHTDEAALETYQAHPDHQAALQWVNTVAADKAVVDYEIA
jgi:hypothetical protein